MKTRSHNLAPQANSWSANNFRLAKEGGRSSHDHAKQSSKAKTGARPSYTVSNILGTTDSNHMYRTFT